MADVRFHPLALAELAALPPTEHVAVRHVIEKLAAEGRGLSFPHASHIRGRRLRELRPRRGRSAWRAFYRRVGTDRFVIASIGPEAHSDRRGFVRAIRVASERLDAMEDLR